MSSISDLQTSNEATSTTPYQTVSWKMEIEPTLEQKGLFEKYRCKILLSAIPFTELKSADTKYALTYSVVYQELKDLRVVSADEEENIHKVAMDLTRRILEITGDLRVAAELPVAYYEGEGVARLPDSEVELGLWTAISSAASRVTVPEIHHEFDSRRNVISTERSTPHSFLHKRWLCQNDEIERIAQSLLNSRPILGVSVCSSKDDQKVVLPVIECPRIKR